MLVGVLHYFRLCLIITLYFWHLETWNIFKESGQAGVSFRLERVYD